MLAHSSERESVFDREPKDLSKKDKLRRLAALVPATAAGAIAVNSIAVVLAFLTTHEKTSNVFDIATAALGALATLIWLLITLRVISKRTK